MYILQPAQLLLSIDAHNDAVFYVMNDCNLRIQNKPCDDDGMMPGLFTATISKSEWEAIKVYVDKQFKSFENGTSTQEQR